MSLQFVETLRGSYFLVERPDDRRVCEVAVHVRLARAALRDRPIEAEMGGTATFDGLASAQPIAGHVRLQFDRPRQVLYAFDFRADDGRALHFGGAKHPSLMRPIYAATTLWGTLSHDGAPLGMVRLHFDLRRDLVAFFQSIARERQ